MSETVRAMVMEALHAVIDPEIGVNVVDLGLIYEARVERGEVAIAMTLTAPARRGDALIEQVREAVRRVPGVARAEVRLVWDPPWTPARMSELARRELGWKA